jgi:hypothetical protein
MKVSIALITSYFDTFTTLTPRPTSVFLGQTLCAAIEDQTKIVRIYVKYILIFLLITCILAIPNTFWIVGIVVSQ